MTRDEKARQVGRLMLELKEADSGASQCRAKVRELQRILQRAAGGRLCTTLAHDKEYCLGVSDGQASSERINLPTTEELFAAVKRVEQLSRKGNKLRKRLEDLGFAQGNPVHATFGDAGAGHSGGGNPENEAEPRTQHNRPRTD